MTLQKVVTVYGQIYKALISSAIKCDIIPVRLTLLEFCCLFQNGHGILRLVHPNLNYLSHVKTVSTKLG